MTNLIRAILERNISEVSKLLQEGTNPNENNPKGISPLIYAASIGNKEIIIKLMEFGSYVTYEEITDGNTVYFVDKYSNNNNCINMLENMGAVLY